MISLAALGVSAVWEGACGHLPVFRVAGRDVLWSAPWRDDPGVQADAAIPVVDRRLGGSFACLPFGGRSSPPHGSVANLPWRLVRRSPSSLVARIATPEDSASVRVALRDGHPVLYQTHILYLDRANSFALHPMLTGVTGVTTSPLRCAHTFTAMEAPGVERWQPDTRWEGLPPWPRGVGCDFAMLLAEGGLGWTAATRADDTILFLRPAAILPVTNLWLWNGGRHGAPWDGAALDVLGVEDGICAGADDPLDPDNRIAAEGVPTALPPGRHVIPTAIARLPRAATVRHIALGPDTLTAETDDGPLIIPFDGAHLT